MKASLDIPNPPEPSPVIYRIPLASPWREYGLPLLLFLLSVVTTTAIGARFMQNFQDGRPSVASDGDLWPWPWLFREPHRFLLGWPFSVALLSILLIHEFGHYFACRYHGIRATLPWVLPAPTLSGTAGAVIQIRERIPNRRALMDIGAYGPIAGYLASLIAIGIGFLLSRPIPPGSAQGLIAFGEPATLRLVHWGLTHVGLVDPHSSMPSFADALRHPVLLAGWVGLFITSLNLIPGGQLDGGHILYALSPRLHRGLRWVLPAALLLCGVFFWIGWFLWALILLTPAMRHPRVPRGAFHDTMQALNPQRRLLACIALVIFFLTFSISPFGGSSLIHYLHPLP